MNTFLMFFFVILFSIQIYPQINLDEFPKIGYFDMYAVKRAAYYNNNQIDYSDSSWFYPALSELGLSHVVTTHLSNSLPLSNKPPYEDNFNSNIKIIDNIFARASTWTFNKPYKYSHSAANYIDHFAYEAGGENIALITNKDHNFGFGNADHTSWWIYGYNSQCIGDPTYPDPLYPGTIVHFAQVGGPNGILLKAGPDAWHLPFFQKWGHKFYYKLSVRARIDGEPGNVNVAKVRIWEEMPGATVPDIQHHSEIYNNMEDEGETLNLTDVTYYITADNFGGTQYKDLESPITFRKTVDLNSNPTSNLFITIEWLGTRNLYIDKIAIYNNEYEDLFIINSQVVRNNIKNDMEGIFGSVKSYSLFSHPYNDEPFPIFYRGVGEVSNLSEQQIGSGKYVNGATLSLSNDLGMIANSQRRLPYVLYDLYPITENTSTSSSGPNSLQHAFDNLVYSYWGSPGYGVQRYNGIRAGIELAQNFTPYDPIDDIPFYHTIQVHSEKNIYNGQWVEPFRLRAPTYNEILAQGNLALCYGAKGIMYFLICTLTPSSAYTDTAVASYGLFEQDGVPSGTLTQDPAAHQCRNNRYWAVKELNRDISLIENELLTLTWKDAFSFHKETERQRLYSYQGHYITDVQSFYYIQNPDTEVPDPLSESFVEIGVFKKTTEYTNDLLDYFMLVNRRGLEDEGRTYKVTYDKTGSQYVNWSVTDIASGNYWSGWSANMFAVHIDPGKGKLFSLEPTVIGGGSLYYDEVIQSDIELKRDLTIETGVNLYVNADYHCYGNIILNGGDIFGNGKIIFHNNKRITVAGGTSQIFGSSGTIELDFTAPHHMNGIQVLQGANFRAWNCIIKNARFGITAQSNAAYLRASNVQFYNCSAGGINIYGPLSLTPIITVCQFNNLSTGLIATNLSEIRIQYNQFINNDIGINLINVTTPYITDNLITSDKKILPGIFLESCDGVIWNNLINGHTNGIYLGNSSPDIGVNQITNNLYHGIYIGNGSLPKMNAKLFYDTPIYYPVSGYNQIWENGGTTTGGPKDNDGSELFFNNSNAIMQKGCNSIYDDREGSDHPPYNTRLLMNGIRFGLPIFIQAEANFWSDNPQYPLRERFGNLIVDYDPFLLEPCEIPGGGGSSEELFVKSSTGEVIDTLYPVQRTVENLTNTDLLYAVAEEKFISADYTGAEEMFNQIVNSSDSLEVKLPAYRRLYDLGKLSSKPESYFNNLNNVYTSLVQSTSDSLMISIFNQLGSLSLVGEEEYIQAIEEFDDVIQQNPGSEKAVYAEIDAFTTALLIEKGDTTLGKSVAQNYMVNSSEYESKISNLLKNNFGAPQKTGGEFSVPTCYNLYQNFPNPFNPITTIKYDLVENGNVKLAVYDILGREVMVLVNEQQQPGRYEVQFSASNLSSGVYIYRLISDDYISSMKMILVK